MTELTKQQEICMKCQQCCRYSCVPINPDHDHLKLLWLKNVPLMYSGESRYWSIYLETPCRYADWEKGCLVYDQPEKKAAVCERYLCVQKCDQNQKDILRQVEESKILLNEMFGDKNNGDTSESDNGGEI
jgi:hypothetical protein